MGVLKPDTNLEAQLDAYKNRYSLSADPFEP
jgi:hypothetical protein